ncbi:MAG TPA: hypothetical protein VGV60_10340 [Candidatus Polarisedimenticolia bacterium]|nr:hypothetical protein [Candidatus Polarisedimenticolia bacterium]
MKILNFPARVPRPPAVSRSIVSVETLLAECRGRQAALRDDGRRLMASLDRLSLLTENLIRGSERLRHTLLRLRNCRVRPGTQAPRD